MIGESKKIAELDKMLGKSWMYKTKVYNFLNYRAENDKTTLCTKEKWFDFGAGDELMNFISQCLPVAEGSVMPSFAPSDSLGLAKANINSDNILSKLRGELLDSIEKVKNDPKYVNQAKQIVNITNAVVNTAKLELQVWKKL